VESFIHFLENNMLSCSWKTFLDQECMGCGMQRAIILLLKGEFLASIKMYPALIPLLVMFGYLAFHLKFNFENGPQILKYLFIFNVLLIVINFLTNLI